MTSILSAGSPTSSTLKRRTASLMAMIRRARRASTRSAKRQGPVRNGSGLCFVETTGVRVETAP